MEITNAPASLGEFIAFRENPFNVAITLPSTYPVVEPVTAELWFRDVKQVDQIVPVTVTGQKIEFTFTVVQLRAMVKTKFYILFNGEYVFFAPITATMGGAIPEAREVFVSIAPVGEVLVSVYSDKATVGLAQSAADAAQDAAYLAKQYRDEAAANATGAVDPAGTFNATTGLATQNQSDAYPAATFTPTASSTKPKGYFLDINVAGTTSVTGAPISVAKGGRIRSNGVGFPWTYVEPADTGYEIATDLADRLPERNIFDPGAVTLGKVMTSLGVISDNAGYALLGLTPIKPNTDYSGKGSDPLLMRYACFRGANGTTVVSGGWDGESRDGFTSPATAYYVQPTIGIGDVDDFQLEESPVPRTKVDHGVLVGNGMIKIEAADVLTGPDLQFVNQAQIDSLETAATLTQNFKQINLANPDDFVTGALMQSTGVPVSSGAWIYVEKIPVTPGDTIFLNSDENTGSRYAALYAANGTDIVAGGWNATNTFSKLIPVGAHFISPSFPSAFASSVRVGIGASDPGYVPHGELYGEGVHFSPDSITETPEKMFVSEDQLARLDTIDFLDDKYNNFEARGILQKKIIIPSPIQNDISQLVAEILQGSKHLIVDCDNGSKSTGVAGYCTATPNSNTWPEFCREQNLWQKWVGYIWKTYFHSQKHERFDTAGRFTITGSVDTSPGSGYTGTNNAPHWGHQWPNGGDDFGGPVPNGQVFFDRYYQIIKPTSGAVAIAFAIPNSYYMLAWMTSWSHLTGRITFTVAGGANRLEICTSIENDTWAEAHNAFVDAYTPDEFKTGVNYTNSSVTSTKIRKDQHSMPIMFRRKAGFTLSDSTLITATMETGKQIEHWGIYYTRSKRMFIPVCSAKGSHASVNLEPFHEFGIDKRKPNLFLYDVPIVNEWRVGSVEPTDTPTAYAARIVSHATTLLSKSYIKGLVCRFGMWHRGMNVFEAAADQPTQYLTSEGYNNGFDYMRRAINELIALKNAQNALPDTTKHGRIAISDAQPAFLQFMRNYGTDQSLSMYQSTWSGTTSPTVDTPTMDGTHDGDMGAEIQWRFDMNNWNF
jgi:hypothetical protein